MAGGGGAFVVRNTFLEVADASAENEPLVRRWNSAPPSIGAEKKAERVLDVFDGPRLASSSALYDSPQQKVVKTPAWEPPSAHEAEEWLGAPASGLAREEGAEADGDELAAEEGLEGRDIATMTTVILRNVPHSCTRADLLDLLDSQGFYGRYDFLYLPVKFGSSSAFGYAFINLVEHEDARRFQAHFQNFTNWNVPCNNTASVSWSKAHQGLTEHIERYRNSPMMHPSMPDECKPIILRSGHRVEFPPPTKKASPTRRSDKARSSRKRHDTAGSRAGPGSVSSLASDLRSEVSCSSDHWKAGSTVSSMSTPAGSTIAPLAEPMASPLFQGLTWLGGGEERNEPERSEVGLYQLTTQMICGSDTSSETSLRSSVRSQITNSSHVPSTCSSKGRRGFGTTLLAAGLEVVPDTVEQYSQGSRDDGRRRQQDRKWWNPFSSSTGSSATVPSAHFDSPSRRRQEPPHRLGSAPQPVLPGSVVELVGVAGPPGQQGRVLVVDHAKESYKVQLCDGNIRMVKGRHVRFVR